MPTLAELRAQGGQAPRPRSTHTVTLITGQHLLDEQKRLNDDLLDLLAKAARTGDDDEAAARTRKGGQKSLPPRAAEIRQEIAALHGRLAEHQGQITLVGNLSDGEWLRWKDAHPPREDSEADQRLGGGLCNTSDLYADLGLFVAEWNGETLAEGDWLKVGEQITFADKRDLVTEVVDLYETRLNRAPKSLSDSSETPPGSDD